MTGGKEEKRDFQGLDEGWVSLREDWGVNQS